jgi:hypothetical protein
VRKPGGCAGDPAEAQDSGNNRNDEKRQRPAQHFRFPPEKTNDLMRTWWAKSVQDGYCAKIWNEKSTKNVSARSSLDD